MSDEPEQRAATWRDVFAPGKHVSEAHGAYQFPLGPHYLAWMDPATYEHFYRSPWRPTSHHYGEMALLHLLAEDLPRCRDMLRKAGRETKLMEHSEHGNRTLWVGPGGPGEPALHITQQPADEWARARSEMTGEGFELVRVHYLDRADVGENEPAVGFDAERGGSEA